MRIQFEFEAWCNKIPKGKRITCGSRFLFSIEANYAVIELELLAIQWAFSRSRLYLSGKKNTNH